MTAPPDLPSLLRAEASRLTATIVEMGVADCEANAALLVQAAERLEAMSAPGSVDLDAIEEKAKRAAEGDGGEWVWEPYVPTPGTRFAGTPKGRIMSSGFPIAGHVTEIDAAHIIGTRPAMTLAVIAEVRSLRADFASLSADYRAALDEAARLRAGVEERKAGEKVMSDTIAEMHRKVTLLEPVQDAARRYCEANAAFKRGDGVIDTGSLDATVDAALATIADEK